MSSVWSRVVSWFHTQWENRPLVLFFLILAIAHSFSYGWWAFPIHEINQTNLPSVLTGVAGQSYSQQPFTWKVHQFLFNFIGSFTGWGALYYLIFIRLNLFKVKPEFKLEYVDIIIFIIGMIGITGYIPVTIDQIERLLGSVLQILATKA